MDKHAILAVKKNEPSIFLREIHQGNSVWAITQMRHAAFSILPPFSILFEFSVHSASVYLTKISSDESSDSEMPYDSSDEEVWEEEELSGDDDSDGGPGFLDPTRRAPRLHVV